MQQIDIHHALIDRCRRGDRKAQFELYQLYAKAMYNVALRIVGHAGEAEDVLQEAFVDAFANIAQLRTGSVLGAWLKRIVVNRAINNLRRRNLVLFAELPDVAPEQEHDSCHDEEIMLSVERVRSAMALLPEGYRVVLSLYLLEGYDHAEIAQILNVTETTSKTQYSRAKARLRLLLNVKDNEG